MRDINRTAINPDDFGDAFLKEDPVDIYNQCIDTFQNMITVEQFTEMVNEFNEDVDRFYLEHKIQLGDYVHYIWLDNNNKKAISVHFDADNYISKLLIKPYITYPQGDNEYTELTYSMPINEEWDVFWGGTNEFVNYHYIYETQRYAYDLLIIKDDSTYENNQLNNENYYAFGKDVTAPSFGKVIEVVGEVKDNVPGEMNEAEPLGNYVIIQHDKNEYSVIAHFKLGSITVKEGDIVEQGQVIGQCGNSGNSSEPHIHFQVMNTADINKGKSLRIKFADGADPIQGDVVTQSFSSANNEEKKNKRDVLDKLDTSFSIIDFILFVPRFVVRGIRWLIDLI